jgi:hypothetical protein
MIDRIEYTVRGETNDLFDIKERIAKLLETAPPNYQVRVDINIDYPDDDY